MLSGLPTLILVTNIKIFMHYNYIPYITLQFIIITSGVPRNFFSGGVKQIQLRTEDRGNGDLGAVAP